MNTTYSVLSQWSHSYQASVIGLIFRTHLEGTQAFFSPRFYRCRSLQQGRAWPAFQICCLLLKSKNEELEKNSLWLCLEIETSVAYRAFSQSPWCVVLYQQTNRCSSLPQPVRRNVLCESVTEICAGAVAYPLTGACFWNILCVISYYIRKKVEHNRFGTDGETLTLK